MGRCYSGGAEVYLYPVLDEGHPLVAQNTTQKLGPTNATQNVYV